MQFRDCLLTLEITLFASAHMTKADTKSKRGSEPHSESTLMSTPYRKLTGTFTRLHRYQHLMSIAGWDQMTFMPSQGREARAATMGEMATLIHRTLTDAQIREWIEAARSEALDELEQTNLAEMEQAWRNEAVLPEALVEARVLAAARCEHAWRELRPG